MKNKYQISLISNKSITRKITEGETEVLESSYEGSLLGAKRHAFKMLKECAHQNPFTSIEIHLNGEWLSTSGMRHGKFNDYEGSRWYNTNKGLQRIWMDRNKTNDYEYSKRWYYL